MTVHSAKGLEFNGVILIGLEEDTLPHFNSLGSQQSIEEERRLCYVAITRACKELCISWSRQRRRYGGPVDMLSSLFLKEIPKETIKITDPVQAQIDRWKGHGFSGQAGASWSQDEHRPVEPVAGDIEIDRSYDQTESDTPGAGTRVRHARFGVGIIDAIRGTGPEARVDVRFREAGNRTIIARFLVRAD